VNHAADNEAKNDMYVIIGFNSQGAPVGVIVGLCVMCAKWVYMYYFKHETPPFVEDTIQWLLQVVIEYLVCSICDYMEPPQETLVYIEPVPFCNKCHSDFSWEGYYWYCHNWHVAL